MYTIRVFASTANVAIWAQLFFWLRLFDQTARYVDLIIDTVIDIFIFTCIMVLLLLMFATGVYMIQINRLEYPYGEAQLLFDYDNQSELNLLLEAVLYQYRMLLGDFDG